MITGSSSTTKKLQHLRLGLALAVGLLGAGALRAEDAPAANAKPAPLPLHQIEGNGGIFSTLSAYIVNPPRDGEPVGRPSVGLAYVHLGDGRHLEALTLTESPFKRLELGYGYDTFDLGDLPTAIKGATGISPRDDSVKLHNLNARFLLVEESEALPAITAGLHYKKNQGIDRINTDLGGLLRASGIARDDGLDFTLYASKLFKSLPTPLLINAGLRATKAAHIGLLGFTDDYKVVAEANAVLFLTGNFALAAEYRQKPNNYTPIGTLVQREDDWFTIDAAYVVNSHLTLAAGYGHFGSVLNHQANGVWGLTTKYEF